MRVWAVIVAACLVAAAISRPPRPELDRDPTPHAHVALRGHTSAARRYHASDLAIAPRLVDVTSPNCLIWTLDAEIVALAAPIPTVSAHGSRAPPVA